MEDKSDYHQRDFSILAVINNNRNVPKPDSFREIVIIFIISFLLSNINKNGQRIIAMKHQCRRIIEQERIHCIVNSIVRFL